ncbi:MAG: hypothetical protein US76_04290 [Parcubacteria group bacterium GW2011_GWA2_38_13b]|nr:MAG: hypothetical protein US76_04290 [Parcubacteria group bacterium GW2011_GWA2_38_13b]
MKNNKLFTKIIVAAVLILPLFFFAFSFRTATAASVIETKPALFLSKTRVQLNGFLNPSDLSLPANYWFEWGRTDALGNFTYPRTVRTTASRSISERITLPDPAVNYFFRVVIQNHESKEYGQIMLLKVPNETIDSKSFSNTVSGTSLLISQSNTDTLVVAAVLPLAVNHTIANLSFPNGAESVVAGKAGDVFEFLVGIENISDKPVYNLHISDKLSVFLEFFEASPNYKYSNSSQNEVSWDIPKIASRARLEFTIKVRGKKFSENVVIENIVTVANKDFLVDSATTTILLNNSPLELIFKSKNKKVPPGGISEYEIYYRNEAEISLINANLQIFLPEELQFKESDRKFAEKDNALSLEIGEIKPGQEDIIQFTAVVSEAAKNKKTIVVFATIKYQKNLSLNEELLTVVAESIVDKDFMNLTAAIIENNTLPSVIVSIIIIALLGLLIILFYRHRLYRDRKEKESLVLADTIKELEQKLKILTENQEEQTGEHGE